MKRGRGGVSALENVVGKVEREVRGIGSGMRRERVCGDARVSVPFFFFCSVCFHVCVV